MVHFFEVRVDRVVLADTHLFCVPLLYVFLCRKNINPPKKITYKFLSFLAGQPVSKDVSGIRFVPRDRLFLLDTLDDSCSSKEGSSSESNSGKGLEFGSGILSDFGSRLEVDNVFKRDCGKTLDQEYDSGHGNNLD